MTSEAASGNAAASANVKLSCRNVWKIYGENPAQFFDAGNIVADTPRTLADLIGNKDHIVANADVSFDVHVGEIFVIM